MRANAKMTPVARRERILNILSERREEKVANLAFELGVCRRTILSDVAELILSYPIETVRGNGGCVRVMPGYYIHRKCLRPEQRDAIYRAIETADTHDCEILKSIINDFS